MDIRRHKWRNEQTTFGYRKQNREERHRPHCCRGISRSDYGAVDQDGACLAVMLEQTVNRVSYTPGKQLNIWGGLTGQGPDSTSV